MCILYRRSYNIVCEHEVIRTESLNELVRNEYQFDRAVIGVTAVPPDVQAELLALPNSITPLSRREMSLHAIVALAWICHCGGKSLALSDDTDWLRYSNNTQSAFLVSVLWWSKVYNFKRYQVQGWVCGFGNNLVGS